MPEKVHTKFGDDANSTSAPSKDPNQDGKTDAQSNGLKRNRDGSPKPSGNPAPSQSQDHHPANSKKQRTNSQSQGSANVSTQPNGLKSPKQRFNSGAQHNGGSFNKGSNAAPQKTGFGKGASQGGQPQNSYNKNKAPQAKPQHAKPQQLAKVAKALEEERQKLPIWANKADIRWALRNNDVLLLNGETGSGKSTQTPQFLCDEPWCKKQAVKITNDEGRQEDITVGGVIAITEPRRVAAITLAQRVAREMGSYIGKEKQYGSVGYSVRFDSNIPQGMKIKFVTEGMLLQEMLRDPHLRQYSAVIVDEIHERSVDVDLIAGFLRQMIHGDKKGRGGVPLKVVIMSATMDLGGLEAFFAKPKTYVNYTPGNNHQKDFFGIHDQFLPGQIIDEELLANEKKGGAAEQTVDDESRRSSFESVRTDSTESTWEGFSDTDISIENTVSTLPGTNPARLIATTQEPKELPPGRFEEDVPDSGVVTVYAEGRQYDVKIFYEVKPSPDYLHNILQTILRLHVSEALPGDILAFLTGQEEIQTLQTQLETYAGNLAKEVPRMKIMPLYGSLSPEGQQAAFEKVKEPRTRKIVLATNIAETSVTVSGVRFVIDCGKSKVKQYRPRLGMESLLAKPISVTSAIQRAGRAGREGPGKCFRIYTAEDCMKMETDELPEILRSDVVEAVLKMKARGVDDVLSFPLMDSPDIVAMEKALLQLHSMEAIDDEGKLTQTGKRMAEYPLPAAHGRVLIAAAEADCLLEAIDVIACLNTDADIFIQAKSEEDQETIEEHRKDLQHRSGDILTYLNTMQKYAAETTDRTEWCKKRLVSTRAMKMAMLTRKQLRQTCLKQKLLTALPPPDPQPAEPISEDRAEALTKAFLTAFATKTAVLGPDGGYHTSVGKNLITIHPSSVMFGKKVEAIMFLDHVFTTKSFAKKVSAIQANWISGALGL